ncbi:MAG: hypothetical protein IKG27_04555 [Bacilli bacterium]|nr:hypothetical protein [Bacilli bacterium]
MKKINCLFILITIVLAFFKIFSELDQGIVIFLKNGSIVLTLFIPYILNKLFKLNINEGLIFLWIIFIFLAHYLGVICELYNKVEAFDKITHTFSGFLSSGVAILILDKIKSKKLLFNIIFILSFTSFCACLWEVFEFVCNEFVGGDAQRVALTGVSDTMWDMIVALLGSIIVIIVYYFKKYSVKEIQ